MIKNYFKMAWRTLSKNMSYSAINIVGLSVSLCATILILLWVWDELSFDRMHDKAERIFQVSTTFDSTSDNAWPVGSAPLAEFGQKEIPAIEASCRFSNSDAILIKENDNQPFEESGKYIDDSFFQLFDFPLIAGDRAHPFSDKHAIILTKSLAQKYFGNDNALGKSVLVDSDPSSGLGKQPFTVTAIIDDFPLNSSVTADFLLPFALLADTWENGINDEWGNFRFPTFFLLRDAKEAAVVGKQLADMHRRHNDADIFKGLVYYMQPFTSVHLFNAKGQERGMQQVRIFIIVAMVTLLIACINYVNLVTARSSRRMKEIGMRKISGATRIHLFWQFITESFVVTLIAIVLALGLAYLFLPIYNTLSGKEMMIQLSDIRLWLVFAGCLVLVLLMAGVYPALLLSTFRPIKALKGFIIMSGRNNSFRKTLVVVQFVCSVVLIISTLVIGQQLEFIRQKDLGYDKENVFIFGQQNFASKFEAIRTELMNKPGIIGISAASSDISNIGSGTGDINWEGKPASMSNFMINKIAVDHEFVEVMNLEILAGKSFTGTPADSSYILLNESAIKAMGLNDPVGKSLTFMYRPVTIAGIIKDFHFADLKREIEPCVLYNMGLRAPLGAMYVRTASGQADHALAGVRQIWSRYNANLNFNYKFLDSAFDEQYKSDIRAGKLFKIFAGIAILVSCLGLFGLVTFTVETKVKEIGIRKTLGASISQIIIFISKDFLKLVGISFVIAFPLGWWMMKRWLEDYVYRTDIAWWVFVFAGIGAFGIAAITVCGKSLRAAKSNPINSLRNE
ncbi:MULTISPECIES: ABC transporter permease [Sphingobacterium]|uniref:ABC transporter permease n=1 Tax=Sphingobacterium populi TaxID=1812824 RepID=A0ABW5UD60_9SPHI|nr:ABC transporter permease [Sphingobacterium sp. CFCC 11742]